MRVPVSLISLLLASCSSLLGIEDPGARQDVDAGVDAEPIVEHLRFTLGDFKLAQGQRARLKVEHVRTDGTVEDVTRTVTIASDAPAIVMVTSATITSGAMSGTATITASLGSLPPASVKATVTDVACHPVINELKTGSSASAADEWVEIYNPCLAAIDVTGWTLNYRSMNAVTGNNDSNLLATLDGTMAPGALRLYAGNAYPGPSNDTWNGGATGLVKQEVGAVGLRSGPTTTGPLVDAVGYGKLENHPFVETTPAPAMSNGLSAARQPDGIDYSDGATDGNNALNFTISATLTPGTLNAP